jgi:hypothetical protein
MGISVGYIEKQTTFAERHRVFFERRANLMMAINTAFDRTLEAVGNHDPLIFYLGMRAVDDFEAVAILAANDLALPAQAVLRGMYERLVTIAHLHSNPSDATDFAEFDYVQRRKLAKAMRDALGYSPEDPATLEEFEREYQRVKARYEVSCEKCGTKRMGPSWSKLDFVTQTKRQPLFAPYIAHAYYLPLLQAHSTLRSASSQLQVKDGQLSFITDRRDLSDEVFRLAYVLLLNGLATQEEHFHTPGLSEALEVAIADHIAIYPEDAGDDSSGGGA